MSEKKPLLSHLDELFMRIRWIFFALIAASGIGYSVSRSIIGFFQKPLYAFMPEGFKLIYTQPLEKFWVVLKVSTVAGVALALPIIAYQVYAFLVPAMKNYEKNSFLSFLLAAFIAFSTGVYLGYEFVLPVLIQMIVKFASLDVLPFLTLSSYINSVLGLLLLCGLLCEVPIAMIFLSGWGLVKSSFWSEQRKVAIVLNAIISAFLSPPDPLSMLVMMIPLHLLFETGIFGARLAEYFFASRRLATAEQANFNDNSI